MNNHFYTLLLNINHDASNKAEHIAKDFFARELPSSLGDFYSLLFKGADTRAQKIMLAQRIVALVNSTMFAPSITQYDRRITQPMDMNGANFTFTLNGERSDADSRWDALALYSRVMEQPNTLHAMLAAEPAGDKEYTPSDNAIYNLANILVCYVDRVHNLST